MIQVPEISIVIPAYNESENIVLLNQQLTQVLKQYEKYEIIYVNDGSTDNTLSNIKALCKNDERVKYINFSRNFGHQCALKAGIDFSSGKCIISMDADLQHPPELILQMIEYWRQGYDIVYTQRLEDEKISLFKKVASKFFYKLLRSLSDLPIEEGTADLRNIFASKKCIYLLPRNWLV